MIPKRLAAFAVNHRAILLLIAMFVSSEVFLITALGMIGYELYADFWRRYFYDPDEVTIAPVS